MIDIETPLVPMKAPVLAGKKLVLAPILRAGVGFLDGMLSLVPVRARRAYRALSRPEDAGGGRVLLQGARGRGRSPCAGARSDAGDRQFGDRGGRPAEGGGREEHPHRVPARRARGDREIPRPSSRGAHLDRRDRRAARTSTATSFRASATPATGCTGRSRRGAILRGARSAYAGSPSALVGHPNGSPDSPYEFEPSLLNPSFTSRPKTRMRSPPR